MTATRQGPPDQPDEFIDAYSDDIHRLRDAWSALRSADHLWVPITEAALCRILIVVVVGNIEGMMHYWKREWGAGDVLDAYLSEKPKRANAQRVRDLSRAMREHGINVDDEILADFLAIKMIRNRIVHSVRTFDEDAAAHVLSRGFPTDVRKLREPHWHKVMHTDQMMMAYIVGTGARGGDRAPADGPPS